MQSNRRKLVLIVGVVAVLVVGGLILLTTHHKNLAPKSQSSTESETLPTSKIVIIDNAATVASSVPSQSLTGLESMLYSSLKANTAAPRQLYHGSVRSGSISTNTDLNSTAETTFLVDIPSLQQTYQVSISNNSDDDYHGVYVYCPTPDQLVYPAFNCVQEEQ